MKTKTRVLISCVLVAVAFCAGVFVYAQNYMEQKAMAEGGGTYFVDADGKIEVPIGGTDTEDRKSRGTATNPFFVLEITPFEGYAQFGYQISGCEPADVYEIYKAASYNTGPLYGQSTFYTANGTELKHNNVFLRESIGLAYDIVNGVRVAVDEATVAQRIADYNAIVYTVTPEDLNNNLGLIDRADLITFVLKDDSGAALNAYKGPYVKSDLFSHADSAKGKRVKNVEGATFVTNPLDWAAVVKIYERATDIEKSTPILWDTHTYNDIANDNTKSVTLNRKFANGTSSTESLNGTQNNLYKLFLMLYQMSPVTFEAIHGDPSTFATVDMASGSATKKDGSTKLKTGVFQTKLANTYTSTDAKTYWGSKTFYPWELLPNNNSTEYIPVLDTLGIMNENGIYHFNSGSAQNFVRNMFYLNDGGNWLRTDFNSISLVNDDQYSHDLYVFFDSIGVDTSAGLTSAQCLYYLLNGINATPNAMNNEDYKVLELQPTPNFENKTSFWNGLVATYANTFGTVEVDQMTTSEFIGKQVELLSEYDLIYIGTNTYSSISSNPLMKYSGTQYIYAHTGPKVTLADDLTAMFGWLGTADSNNIVQDVEKEKYFAYSGNDLTDIAKEEIKKFVQKGGAFVFGYDFFTDVNMSSVISALQRNSTTYAIDRNSNIYELANETLTSGVYITALGNSTTNFQSLVKLRTALSASKKVEFTVLESPVEYYHDAATATDATVADSQYISDKILTFKIAVTAPEGKKYYPKLYVDKDGDGIYSSGEEIGANLYELAANGSYNPATELVNGKSYWIRRPVTDRVGGVSWKLNLVDSSQTVYASLSGVSAIKATTTEDLTILQIISKATGSARRTVYLPEEGEVVGTTVTLKNSAGTVFEPSSDSTKAATMKEVTYKFDKYSKGVTGLNIKFVRMEESELVTALSDPDYLLKNFQMVVLGFGDAYNGVSSDTVLTALEEFKNMGRAVLYTHDTSSLIGDGDSGLTKNHSWGKNVTDRFRNMFGMDRYSVMLNEYVNGSASRTDSPYAPSASSTSSTLLKNSSGIALAQGMTNGILYRHTANSAGGNIESNTISRVNESAITNYPYTISPSISVATTHPQYYQLDMENDQIVVWYTLDSDNTSGTGVIDTYYNTSPRDVRNNYYIYNIGNVTYSGMGHDYALTDEEIKLFINTFVAAYRATAKNVSIKVINDEVTEDDGNYYVCVDADSKNAAATVFGADIVDTYHTWEKNATTGAYEVKDTITAKSKRVYFTIEDTNSYGIDTKYEFEFTVDGTSTALAVYQKDTEGNIALVDGVTNMFRSSTNTTNIYFVDVPIQIVLVDNTILTTELGVTAKMNYKLGTEYFSAPDGTNNVFVMPRGLFDLD